MLRRSEPVRSASDVSFFFFSLLLNTKPSEECIITDEDVWSFNPGGLDSVLEEEYADSASLGMPAGSQLLIRS